MPDELDSENRATFARITCNRQQPQHDLEALRTFLRDVHCPCIARRPGLWDYRTEWLDPVQSDLFTQIAGIDMDCAQDQQIQTISDVRWLDAAAFQTFSNSPGAEVRPLLVADIGMLIARSNTYDILENNGWTFVDRSDNPTPLGQTSHPTFALCLRARGDLTQFRASIRSISQRWASHPEVLRLRMYLFEIPDMVLAAKAPAPPQPAEAQYQALIHLQLTTAGVARQLDLNADRLNPTDWLTALHAYPVSHIFSWNRGGRPTIAGLRGYSAAQAIHAFGASHQTDPRLMRWMYGPVADGLEP